MSKRQRVLPLKISRFLADEAEVSGSDSSDECYLSALDSPGSLDEFIDDSSPPPSPVPHGEYYPVSRSPATHSLSSSPALYSPEDYPDVAPLPIALPSSSAQQPADLAPAQPDDSAGAQLRPDNFRLQSKAVFLTYPQCDTPHGVLFDNLKAAFPDPLNHFLVSRERHEDGSWHLHALLDLHKKLRTRRVNYFDALVTPPKHPNIKSKLVSKAATIRYIVKGGDPDLIVSTFDYSKFLEASAAKRSTKATQICTLINEGKTLDEIDDLYPDYVLMHHRHLRDYFAFKAVKARRSDFAAAQLIPVRVVPQPEFMSVWNCRIADWITSNIRQPREHRQAQLWISSPPRSGKTTLIMWLETMFRLSVYFWPRDEHWWDGYSDKAYDLIVLDEFRSQKKITELNPILSGDPTSLSRRSAAPLVKRDNLPVIILSNFTPVQCFHKCSEEQLAPLLDRLLIVDLPANQHLRFTVEEQPQQVQVNDD